MVPHVAGDMAHFPTEGHRLTMCINKYILDQKKHHAKQPFKTEYISLLKLFQIDFKDEYLFEFYD